MLRTGLALALLSVVAVAWAPSVAAGEPIYVAITSPSIGEPTFGELDFSAHVEGDEPIVRVEFFLDGRKVGERRTTPWTVPVDVGDQGTAREFRVVAHGASGRTGTGLIVTPAMVIADQIQIALQQLYVTATRGGERVLDLGRGDFEIIDAKRSERIVTFERGHVPLTAVLLLDASESMKGGRMIAALGGARAFLERLNPLDLAMVMLFSDRPLFATAFADDKHALIASIPQVAAAGGTSLNDHLYASLSLLDRRQGRRVIVLLSDGADVLSALSMGDVLWKVRRSNAAIFWIRLEDEARPDRPFSSAWRAWEANRRELEQLERAVQESGGRIERLSRLEDLDAAFEGVLRELREQYVLGYYPTSPRHDGAWRPVRVDVRRSGVKARTREGYVDY